MFDKTSELSSSVLVVAVFGVVTAVGSKDTFLVMGDEETFDFEICCLLLIECSCFDLVVLEKSVSRFKFGDIAGIIILVSIFCTGAGSGYTV